MEAWNVFFHFFRLSSCPFCGDFLVSCVVGVVQSAHSTVIIMKNAQNCHHRRRFQLPPFLCAAVVLEYDGPPTATDFCMDSSGKLSSVPAGAAFGQVARLLLQLNGSYNFLLENEHTDNMIIASIAIHPQHWPELYFFGDTNNHPLRTSHWIFDVKPAIFEHTCEWIVFCEFLFLLHRHLIISVRRTS